jgi:hypothetical protein
MKIRPYQPKDEAALRSIHAGRAFGDAFPSNIADFLVAVDDEDRPLMAAGAKLVPEITMICACQQHPLVKLKGIALLHEALRDKVAEGNHTEAFAFVSPSVARTFGRHLVRHFGWRESWKAFAIRIERP